jgi:ketosteroid isomerase-like protein
VASADVDLIRSIYESWARGDYSRSDWAHPDIEFAIVDGTEPASATGVDGMARVWGRFLAAWDGHRAEAHGFRELGEGRVLVLTDNSGRGKTSGLELGGMQTEGANVFEIRDGRVTRLSVYFDRRRAMADVERADG